MVWRLPGQGGPRRGEKDRRDDREEVVEWWGGLTAVRRSSEYNWFVMEGGEGWASMWPSMLVRGDWHRLGPLLGNSIGKVEWTLE